MDNSSAKPPLAQVAFRSRRERTLITFVHQEWPGLFGAIAAAIAIKVALVLSGAIPFNGDEAVLGLMARHILQGERPVFFYGQAYMGSLDAWLVAVAFRLLGESVFSIRLVQILLYALFMLTLWQLARRLFTDRGIANLVIWLAALPPVLITTYTTPSLGGYGETLVFGNLILWIGYEVSFGSWKRNWRAWCAMGLVGGLAFWTLGLAGVYLLPVAILVFWQWKSQYFSPGRLRELGLGMAGFLAGSSPWWGYNFSRDWTALHALSGPASNTTTPFQHLIGFLLLGLPALAGLRPPWSPQFAPWPVLFVGMIFYLAAGLFLWRALSGRKLPLTPGAGRLLGLFALVFLLAFVFTNAGVDATGRYLLPLYPLVLMGLATFLNSAWRWRRWAGVSLLALALLLNGVETARAALSEDRITTQFSPVTRFDNRYDAELLDFLRQHGERRGYTNYWVSFRLAFLSQEQVIFAAVLPYRENMQPTPGDDRYPKYLQEADASPRTAYITSKLPLLDEALRQRFLGMGVAFNEKQIGEYHLFYGLSRPVRPGELRLEETIP